MDGQDIDADYMISELARGQRMYIQARYSLVMNTLRTMLSLFPHYLSVRGCDVKWCVSNEVLSIDVCAVTHEEVYVLTVVVLCCLGAHKSMCICAQ